MPERIEDLQAIAEVMRNIEARLNTIHEDVRSLWQSILVQQPEKPI